MKLLKSTTDLRGAMVTRVFLDDTARQVGAVAKIRFPGDDRTLYLAQVHDWEGEYPDPITKYDPIVLNVYDDPDQAYGEIERRAAEAWPPVQDPLLNLLDDVQQARDASA